MNVPKLRFKEFNDEWSYQSLSKYVNRITTKNKNIESNLVLTISAQYGLVDQTNFFNRSVSSSNLTGYYLLNNGDFAYNKSYSNGYPWGAVKRLNKYNQGVVSSLYICFKPNNLINSDFLEQYFETNKWYQQISEVSVEGARNHGLLNIAVNDFFNTKHYIPSIKEQEKISNFLSLLDKKIELQSKKIEDLKLFKLYIKNQIFKDYDEIFKLKDILVKWNKKNKNKSVKYVESISNKYGFISQSDQFEDRNVASKDLNNYYIIEKGVFGYNPSRLNVGSLALKTNDKVSVVSPLYECFTTSQNNQYLLEWFDSKYFRKETISKFEGGVRNTLNFSNLCEIEIGLPTIEKQNKYSKIFKTFNNKIEFEVKKLYKLHELKKGLMQSMFV